MALGYDKSLYILAFDHRGSFQKKFFGIAGQPSPEESDRISDAKSAIAEGFFQAVDDGAPKDYCGLLVDEQFGADIARRARKEGFKFAMPVEKRTSALTSRSSTPRSRRSWCATTPRATRR
jgi:myo-inositol catabolism protein IolC